MIADDGRVKVLDFGLAKQAAAAPSENTATLALSQPGTVLGTAGYMSPEQVRGIAVDHRSDIFSFGVVLYEMITGRRAFEGPSAVETMNAILRDDPPEIPETANVPPALRGIVNRCLEKRPEQRFQSAADLAFALRSISAGTGSITGVQRAAAAPDKGRKWLAPVIAGLAAIALFAGGFLTRSWLSRREPPRFQRITFRKGLVTNARFTADGRNVIYTAHWDGGPARTYFTQPGNPESRDLDLPNDALLLGVSSKSDVAFLEGPFLPNGLGTLARSSVSGGQMRPWLERVALADWAPDASSMAVVRSVNGRFRLEYPIGTTLLDNMNFPPRAIRVSPDGEHIALLQYHEASNVAINVIDRSGKATLLGVVSDQLPNLTDPLLCWRPDGREIWYRSFDPKEWGTMYGMDLKGRRRVLLRVPGHAVIYDVSRDGRVLLRTDTRQVGILGVAPGQTQERDLSCLDVSGLSGMSEDGRYIAATVTGEAGGPKGSVYLRNTDGSPPVRLGDGAAWALSPDGKWVSSFTSEGTGARRYALLPTGAGEERQILIPGLKGMNLPFGWSSDDKTLFVFGPGTKGVRDYLWNSDTGALKPITPDGVVDMVPLVSPDRQRIATKGPDGEWWLYPVDGSAGQPAKGLTEHDIPVGWRADNRSLYVNMHHDENRMAMISTVDVFTGQRTPWKTIQPAQPVDQVGNILFTPDGRAYAYNFLVKTSELYVADGVQ